jgi:peptidoglycan/LPS O-acetylase OafA/YrhL
MPAQHPVIYFSPLLRPDSILLGMALALIAPHISGRSLTAVLALVVSAAIFFSLPNVYVTGPSTIALFPAAAVMCASILWLSLNAPWLTRILGSRVLVYLGKRSFGLYVFHLVAFAFGRAYVLPWMSWISVGPATSFFMTFVITLAISTIMAAVSYRFFERPFLLMKDKRAVVLSRPI